MSYHDYYTGHLNDRTIKKSTLKKGTIVYFSERGHNNFFYPTNQSETLIEDTVPIYPAWVGSNNLKAVLIPESSVKVSGSKDKYIPVWIENKSG